jgi:integrase
MPDRYRALVLLTAFACLRWCEVTALQRQDIDAQLGTVRVRQVFVEQRASASLSGRRSRGRASRR